MDKALNVCIIILGALWVYSNFFAPQNSSSVSWENETRAMFDKYNIDENTTANNTPYWNKTLTDTIAAEDKRPLILFVYA